MNIPQPFKGAGVTNQLLIGLVSLSWSYRLSLEVQAKGSQAANHPHVLSHSNLMMEGCLTSSKAGGCNAPIGRFQPICAWVGA